MVNPIIEVCANSPESCIEAQKGGAYRIELCAGIPEGGTTPSYGDILTAKRHAKDLKINVIIRPRGGDFLYSDLEIETMIEDVKIAKSLGVDGVVFGCLTSDGDVDVVKNQLLMDAAKGLSTTFHRAFDMCQEPFAALESIIALGFDRILTSGLQPTATQGVQLLTQLVERAGDRIIIMPGCGVNESNIAQLAQITKAKEFHMSARHTIDSKMTYRNEIVSMGGTVKIDEYKRDVTNPKRVQDSIIALRNV